MGGRIMYPDVDDAQMLQIYNRSRRTPIQGYGYFVNPLEAYYKAFPFDPNDGSVHTADNVSKFLSQLEADLFATGLDCTQVASYKTPSKLRAKPFALDDGWLVVLGTGFNKVLHVPLPEDLARRVREVLRTAEEPQWWTMRTFTYPPPGLVIAFRKRKQAN